MRAANHHLEGKQHENHADDQGQARYGAKRRQDDQEAENREDRSERAILPKVQQITKGHLVSRGFVCGCLQDVFEGMIIGHAPPTPS